jgi:predicted dehydrogenase
VTSATWKYANGAVGSFTHIVGLQGTNYSCELEVFADGYSLKFACLPASHVLSRTDAVSRRLVNPYVQPVLYVRRPGVDTEEMHTFPDDDPFFSEVSNWLDVVEDIEDDPDAAQILSSFEDACRSYELTWAIREASERNRKARV